jgi:hypothetical protein
MEFQSPMVAVTIISINSKIPNDPKYGSNKVYTVLVPKSKYVQDVLEEAFMATNIDTRPFGTSVCSTSKGDILILDGQHWLCDRAWTAITQEQSFQIQQLTSRDTSMGLKFLIEEELVKS